MHRTLDGSRQGSKSLYFFPPPGSSHTLKLSLRAATQTLSFPPRNKTTQGPTDKSTDEWNKQGGPGQDGGGGLLWADTSWWDDGVLPALLYTLIIKQCLEGTLSKRLMRWCHRGNKSDLAGVRGRAPSFSWDVTVVALPVCMRGCVPVHVHVG